MAEIFVSPGAYVRERDFSYYVSSIGNSALALIGETKKGPAFTPTLVQNMSEFREKFGNLDPNKQVGYCAKSYFKYANEAYVVRVLGADSLRNLHSVIYFVGDGDIVLATLLCPAGTAFSIETGVTASANFGFTANTIYSGDVNLVDSTSPNYLPTLFPRDNAIGSLATQHLFPTSANALNVYSGTVENTASDPITVTDPLSVSGYKSASSPTIVSDVPDGVSPGVDLFTINTISDGLAANSDVKVEIGNIDTGTTTFDITVRDFSDTNANRIILERFTGLNFDPTDDDYILKQIGDSQDDSGDYNLVSKYIYITMADSASKVGLLPAGFGPTYAPSPVTNEYNFPQWVMNKTYNTTSVAKQCLGINTTTTDDDLLMVNEGTPWDVAISGNGSQILGFHLNSGASASYYQLGTEGLALSTYAKTEAKFVVPLVGGNDGWAWSATTRDLLNDTPSDSHNTAWNAAIDDVRNTEEFDINLLALPGVAVGTAIATYAQEMAEERADCLYIADFPDGYTTAAGAANVFGTNYDSSYMATYWPYVKIYDPDNTQNVTIPPTAQVLEALAYTDSVSYPWFAPAGMNRGLLTDVINAKYKLSQTDRDTLYEAKINAIATFPGQGITIWGQRTAQTRSTALDRINVRRMMLYVEKVIAGASKYLVFEQNDETTWDRFKGMVQPILDLVKVKRGLYDFRVIMDETTNTPDMIDRNQMVGQIFIKPTKTAEAILINFNIMATGASFDEG